MFIIIITIEKVNSINTGLEFKMKKNAFDYLFIFIFWCV